jgi:hypothetical protein
MICPDAKKENEKEWKCPHKGCPRANDEDIECPVIPKWVVF